MAIVDGFEALERLSLRALNGAAVLAGARAWAARGRRPKALARLTHVDVGLAPDLDASFVAAAFVAGRACRHLDVAENAHADATFLDAAFPGAGDLACECVVASWCDALPGAALARLVARLPKLARLEARVSDVGDADLAPALARARRLRVLRVSRSNVGDGTLFAVAAATAGGLETLECDWCDVTDAGVLAVLAAAPRLAELNVAGCKLLTDAVLAAAGRSRLRVLDLTYVNNITDCGDALSRRVPRLTVVDYYNEAYFDGALLADRASGRRVRPPPPRTWDG